VYIFHNLSATRKRNNMEKSPKFISPSTKISVPSNAALKNHFETRVECPKKKQNDNNKKKQKKANVACNWGP